MNMHRFRHVGAAVAPAALVLLAACSSDSASADAGAGVAERQARGKYLVDSVLSCGDCHTPRTPDGHPIPEKYLAGVECFIDAHPPAGDGIGCLHSKNLTPDPSGLGGTSDADIKKMLTAGRRPDGTTISAVMPSWLFARLTDEDLDAVVAYLRTVPAVAHTAPPNQAPFDHPQPAVPVDDSEIPMAADGPQAGASHGRYLAMVACAGCHSPDLAPGAPSGRTEDLAHVFQGGRDFKAGSINLPVPPFPSDIYSANLTPDATGLAGWTADEVVRVLHQGIDDEGKALCPPMPFGPMGGFAGITDEDAKDIADYLLHLAPVANAVPGECFAPGGP